VRAQHTFGNLLRMHSMVTGVAEVEATSAAAVSLVSTYLRLRGEVLLNLQGEAFEELREEFERLFAPIKPPRSVNAFFDPERNDSELSAAAHDAQLRLRQLGGWIHGLIDELTFQRRLRVEAEAKAMVQAHT
jgi:hypothetical protein